MTRHRSLSLRALAMALVLGGSGRLLAQDVVWIEGEATSAIDVKANVAGWGNKDFLSGEKWLHISIEGGDLKALPPGGARLRYDFATAKEGSYEVWNRLGFEFVRSPFAWRVDDGAWAESKPEALTTDLMEIDFFCEVAWLKLGDRRLKPGKHTLEIALSPSKNAKGEPERILYASDLICLHPGTFVPDGKHKPGNDPRTPEDRKAAATAFVLPAPPADGRRSSVALAGLWEIARDDEQLPGPVAEPIKVLPKNPRWRAIAVPGDKNTLRPDLAFAHRVWYRTRIEVPPSASGRSSFLVFPQNNLNTTVYVNGSLCGFDKNPFARVQIDVTPHIKTGRNEILVGIRDAWYGYSASPTDPMKLRKRWNLPKKFFGDGFQDLAYPVWNHPESGILATPEFVSAGRTYAADVFCKPSLRSKSLDVEVNLRSAAGQVGERVLCEVLDAAGRVVKSTPSAETGAAPQPLKLSIPWDDARPWWPDDPYLYRLRTTVLDGRGQPSDVSETPFGFREWSIRGKDFLLNGVPWHGWADTHHHDTREDWLAFYRKSNQTFMRFWGTTWMGLPPADALDFFDRNGVVVRRSGMLDGEAIGYNAIEGDPELKKLYGSEIKMDLMVNWRDQMVAQVKGERNHPSVMIWSIENEWLYINCINLYGGLMDRFEDEVVKTSDAVREADPTRPTMTDGGGAGKANRMPVQGDHYTTGPFPQYPTLAYDPNTRGGGRGRWEWDRTRPRFIGEEMFAEGNNPAYAYFGGEEAFSGRAGTLRGIGILARMLTEGARWNGYGAIHFWQSQDAAVGQYAANAPRAVFAREWDATFGSGRTFRRTFRVFNDTHDPAPITFTRSLRLGGRDLPGTLTRTEPVAPGGSFEVDDAAIRLPEITGVRAEGEMILGLSVGGKEVFRDVKPFSVINARRTTPHIAAGELAVFDPEGSASAFLKGRGIDFEAVRDLDRLPGTARVILLGKDALTPSESTSTRLAALALAGKRVVVLEQSHPLRYQGLQPAEMEAADNEGRTAFVEDATHPAVRNLRSGDFFTWSPGEVVYRNAYLKPARGARSIVQCHELLKNSALVEIPVGEGLIVLSQLRVAETLASNVVAEQLLLNLLDHAATYRLEYRPVVASVEGSPRLAAALDRIGLRHDRVADPVAALAHPGAKLVVVAATPSNLKRLAANRPALDRFQRAGGYLVLNGLTPEGLVAYNAIVGVDHMIRPFRRERVTFPPVKDPLMAGLSLGDVAMSSSERIFPWQEGNYVASDIFGHVVDFDEVAPFAAFENDFLANMVNGFVSADAWKLIVNVPAPPRPPLDFALKLPRPQEIVEVEWIGNTFYYPVTRFELIFDGSQAASFPVKPNNDPQTFAVSPPRSGRAITLRLAEWTVLPGKGAVTGLDNIRLKARRSPEFYARVKPMLNVGGLVHYPKGPGGVVLCNLLFGDSEQAPENAEKKRAVLAGILRNLKAPFAGARTIIAGSPLAYTPIDLSKQANQFRTERGWFGDSATTFKDLPTGRQPFAGVPFQVYDFPTSPVPTVVMLGGPGVPNGLPDAVRGIPIGLKADALFFLQAARIDRRRDDRERLEKKTYELARYVITYAEGQSVDVPLISEVDVDDYRQKAPAALPGAQVAWTRPYAGRDESAVAYVKQWTNPRPDAAIRSVDLIYGKDRVGVPALIAITAASAKP